MATVDLVGQVLLLGGVVVMGLVIARLLRLDVSLACLLCGTAAGLLVPTLGLETGVRAESIHELVFYVVLPILIFEAAWHLRPALLRRWLAPILLLSTFGLLLNCAIVATLLYFAIAHPVGFPWGAALLVGTILSATDPVAVVATLKRQGAPEELSTLVEGESLFNDATALVLFSLVLTLATSGAGAELGHTALALGRVFLGGLACGALIGLLVSIVALLLRSAAASTTVLVLSAFGSFYVAEHLLHTSGILSVVATALLSRTLLREHEGLFLAGVAPTWDWMGLFLNGLIFVLMGLVITPQMFSQQWLAIVVAIPAVLLARAATVYGCATLTRLLRRPVSIGWAHILFWGGLRGAIAIVLALSLPTDLPYWWTVQSMVFGVVLFSILVQGTTVQPLIGRFGRDPDTSATTTQRRHQEAYSHE